MIMLGNVPKVPARGGVKVGAVGVHALV